MNGDPTNALSYLFVPGNRPERFSKALASGTHRVIIDLEDAVSPAEKTNARIALGDWFDAKEHSDVLVRINDSSTPWYLDDLAMLKRLNVKNVMLPKCESAAQVASVLEHLVPGASIHALIETAKAMIALNEIASATGLSRLAFGSLDYMSDLNIPSLRDADRISNFALDVAASQIVIASRAAGLPSPLAGVTPELDAGQVSVDAAYARSLGFGAKMCIHPAQVRPVNIAFSPSLDELAWAARVLSAWNASLGGALQLDGKMIDRPVVLKAERMLALCKTQPS
jgi:citrate lyase subunit beta / citryl-CoA lyase